MSKLVVIAGLSYLLGSIPFGYLLVRLVCGEDVRLTGSGNTGATNVSRKSSGLGVLTLFLDAAKGSVAVALACYISTRNAPGVILYLPMSVAGFFAVVGHNFPVWLRFRGGKGVATGLGAFLLIAPKVVLIAAVIFIVVVLVSRHVSLGSIAAAASFPVLTYALHAFGNEPAALAFLSATSLLIIASHHENIRRLLAGSESRLGAKEA